MSEIIPRQYQIDSLNQLRNKLISGKKHILLMASTGAGKSLIMSMIVKSALEKNNRILTVIYGSDLILQTARVYKNYYNIDSQVIMGSIKSKKQNSIVASISTLNNRTMPECDIVLIDEAHLKYDKVIAHYKDKIIIAFSATPFQNCHHYQDYVKISSVKELIAMGFLVQPRHFVPCKTIDTSEVKIVRGEYKEDQLADVSMKITGDIINEWIKSGQNRPTIAFCVNVNHSKTLAKSFNDNNIPAKHLDATSSNIERENALQELVEGKIKIITNVMILTTGVDCPAISCVIHARPTKSEILYIQSNGRSLRPYTNKKDCIILDHANNISRFGLLTDERFPNLKEKQKTKTAENNIIKIWTCKICFCVNENNSDTCTDCGAINEAKKIKIKNSKGELVEISEYTKKEVQAYPYSVMPFGKFKGIKFSEIPTWYKKWASKNLEAENIKERFRIELLRL